MGFITSQYSGIHDIGLPIDRMAYEEKEALLGQIQELDPDKQDKVVQVIQASSEVVRQSRAC